MMDGKKAMREIPEWAKAAIVADYETDDCEGISDYYATKRKRRVFLAWSRHERDLFSEMRKAARCYVQTRALADAGPDAEHRQKWSMGAGYWLGRCSTYATGWRVRKLPLVGCGGFYRDEVQAAEDAF